jgi:hypothetical protein
MSALLSFEQAPPISVPLRFFLTAPLFGVLAGLLLAGHGAVAFDSRWHPRTLALTHLMTLGFMMMTMCGALLQVLPVAAGANVWRPRLTAAVTHLGLLAGTALLVAAFETGAAILFRIAGPLLGATFGFFAAAVLAGLLRSPARGGTILALRLALLGALATGALGVTLTLGFGWPLGLPLLQLTAAHAAWGLIGWGLVLVAGVAYLVVPMFQLTPPYRPRYAIALPLLLSGLCLGWSAAVLGDAAQAVAGALWLGLAAGAASFALVTLGLQRRRRRRIVDATFLFWRTAMIALIAAAALALVRLAPLDAAISTQMDFLLGILAIVGLFAAVINGMLYKIVPFICWLHLQRILPVPPNMHEIIPERSTRGQMRLFLAALAALVVAVLVPELTVVAGLLFAASCLWLQINLARAARLYFRLATGSTTALEVAAAARDQG